MKFKILVMFLVSVSMMQIAAQNKNNQKIVSGKLWFDSKGERINAHGGCVIFHDGIYYWYGEHKEKGLSEKEHADAGVHCYASTNLVDWHDQGMVLSLTKKDSLSDLAFDANQDRPKVVYNNKTKKFVLFFKLYIRKHGSKTAFVGVAVSQSPSGPFNYRHKFLGGNSPNGTGDFAMFQDTNDELYHITVRKPDKKLVIGKMRDDYLLPEGTYQIAKGITKHTEAPAVFKKEGTYHMLASGSTGWSANPARYFTSTSLYGPWEYQGNPCFGTNPNNNLGPEKTYGGQSTFIIPYQGKKDAFIAFFDINKPNHPYDNLYIWLPIDFTNNKMTINWIDSWDLDYFK
ncbi:family 43 glycosylhydrolase [Polaribacter staleyi]|uniref:family 43 glycosylhydrolase n=1 Tax=Polaribacter staleyi TaxID=2022337 RepID=UPI0031BABBCE